ncbi:MAG: hypothetical protein ACE5H5_06800 [Nitrospinota bacterium]
MAEKKTTRGAPRGRKKAARGRDADRLGQGMREAAGEVYDLLAPACKHLLLAEKELLLAARAVLDKAIEKTDEFATRQERRGQRARKVKIKVE